MRRFLRNFCKKREGTIPNKVHIHKEKKIARITEVENEKLDSVLSLSLETEESIRQKSDILNNGYDPATHVWEVIVKYNGDISDLEEEVASLELLLNGYAIMRATRAQLEIVLAEERIEYVELPKNLVFEGYRENQASCIPVSYPGAEGLSGEGILIAVIDSGIQYLLRDFRDETGSRILYLWDQTIRRDVSRGFLPPEGFSEGVEFTKEDIDAAIKAAAAAAEGGNPEEGRETDVRAAWRVVPSQDVTGHGTAVAGIAAGSAASSLYRGVAPGSGLLIVKLEGNRGYGRSPEGSSQNFPLTTDLMRAVTYVIRKAEKLGMPVAVNISIGDTYGAHDGTSLLERFLDAACEKGRNVICIGSGNEALSGGHRTVYAPETAELSVAARERSINVQIWKNYVDDMELVLRSPTGQTHTILPSGVGKQEWITGNTRALIYVSPPVPYSVNEEIFLDLIPLDEYIDSGIWSFLLRAPGGFSQNVQLFLPNAAVRSEATRFLRPDPYLTMTTPAFSSRAVTVGAYDAFLKAPADFSGRDRRMGEEERTFFAADCKPDLAAPGVDVTAPSVDGSYRLVTGTSFAVPIAAGSAALLMEWGIVQKNDPFLYGEKVKAYLRRGARPFLNGQSVPNAVSGYGALCVAESIPH